MSDILNQLYLLHLLLVVLAIILGWAEHYITLYHMEMKFSLPEADRVIQLLIA